MKTEKFEIVLLSEDSAGANTAAYEKVCRYLLQRYYEGCEEYEGLGVFESINGGTGRKRLFNTSSEDERY